MSEERSLRGPIRILAGVKQALDAAASQVPADRCAVAAERLVAQAGFAAIGVWGRAAGAVAEEMHLVASAPAGAAPPRPADGSLALHFVAPVGDGGVALGAVAARKRRSEVTPEERILLEVAAALLRPAFVALATPAPAGMSDGPARAQPADPADVRRAVTEIVHDLRAPLCAAGLWLEAMRRGAPLASERLDRTLRRVAALTDQILTAVQGGVRGSHLVRVSDVVESVLDELRPLAERRQVLLRRRYRSADLVLCDDLFLWRTVENLVVNAIAASPPGATIDIEVAREGDLVSVKVADEGAKAGAAKPREAREPAAGLGLGMGLGTGIARAFATAHGGALQVQKADAGTVAAVTFACSEAPR